MPASRFAILDNGNVGIGTTGPAFKLDVAGSINTSTQYRIAGLNALSISGFDNSNTLAGAGAGTNVGSGNFNSFFGRSAGETNSTGSNNSFYGFQAGFANSSGSNNAFFGWNAGQNSLSGGSNTFIGRFAGGNNVDGDRNTALGSNAGVESGSLQNATAIGASARVTQSNSLVLGSIDGVGGATANTKVGIGTTAPTRHLHVKGPGDQEIGIESTDTNGHQWSLQSSPSGDFEIIDRTVAANRVRVQNDGDVIIQGNVGIGTGNFSPSVRLFVEGSIGGGHIAEFRNSSDTAGADLLKLIIDGFGSLGETNNFITFSRADISTVGAIQGNGSGGIELISGSGDYAEWLPRLNTGQKIQAGEIVGLYGESTSRRLCRRVRVSRWHCSRSLT